MQANSWKYKLQAYTPSEIKKINQSTDTIWVVDYSRDGSEYNEFQSSDVSYFKNDGNTILSYFSIGEAESYRFYWKSLPKDVLLKENPHWPGNFKVKFWLQNWKNTLIYNDNSYLNKILRAGFDGVYLDIVDAFQYYQGEDKKQKARLMSELIIEISEFAQSKNKHFNIVIQNGIDIIEYLTPKERSLFMDSIDGIGIEDLHIGKPQDKVFTPDPYRVTLINKYIQKNKKVLMVEYFHKNKTLIDSFLNWAKDFNVLALVTDRNLEGKVFFESAHRVE